MATKHNDVCVCVNILSTVSIDANPKLVFEEKPEPLREWLYYYYYYSNIQLSIMVTSKLNLS